MPKVLLKQPNVGKILRVQQLYDEVQDVIYNARYMWDSKYDCTTEYRNKLAGKVEVHCNGHRVIAHRTIIDKNPGFTFLQASRSGVPSLATNPNNTHAYANIPTSHFDSIVFYMKLRWLLKCHSALCELDNNYCSLRRIIQGMHTLGVQEAEVVACDSVFETRRRKMMYRPRQVVDDILEQIERTFGKGYEPFMEYVASCDSRRALNINKTDLHQARVTYNDKMELMIEEIFLADFCEFPTKTHKFAEVFADIESYRLPVPRILPMKSDYVHDYMVATSAGARESKEKGAQFQSIHIAVNMDIEDLGEFSTDAQLEDQAAALASGLVYRKVLLPMQLYEAAFSIIGHKLIFREGVRNRILELIKTRYDVDDFLLAKLVDLTHINLDSRLLTEDQLHKVVAQEKEKLCKYFEVYHKSTLPFLSSSIVGMPSEEGKNPRYWCDKPIPAYMQTREDTHFIHVAQPQSRPEFVVPMIGGPLRRDPDSGQLKADGFFQKMEGTLV